MNNIIIIIIIFFSCHILYFFAAIARQPNRFCFGSTFPVRVVKCIIFNYRCDICNFLWPIPDHIHIQFSVSGQSPPNNSQVINADFSTWQCGRFKKHVFLVRVSGVIFLRWSLSWCIFHLTNSGGRIFRLPIQQPWAFPMLFTKAGSMCETIFGPLFPLSITPPPPIKYYKVTDLGLCILWVVNTRSTFLWASWISQFVKCHYVKFVNW